MNKYFPWIFPYDEPLNIMLSYLAFLDDDFLFVCSYYNR